MRSENWENEMRATCMGKETLAFRKNKLNE